MSRRRNPSLGDIDTLVLYGVIGVGLYVLYKMFTGAKKEVTDAQAAAASAVADLFPNNVVAPGSGGQFNVTMPDGSTQVVNAGQLPVANPANAPYDTSILPDFSAGNF
jgi:hypothetical protein